MGPNMQMMVITACCIAVFMSMSFNIVYAPDPAPLQEFCVAVNDTKFAITVNGHFCKNPRAVTSRDFVFRGYNTPGDPNNRFGSDAVMTNVDRYPALNYQGVSMGRVDFLPGGVNPPHLHPRASEMFTVTRGTLFVGFVAENSPEGENRLFSAILKEGDAFVFPQGLIHFQMNIGKTYAVANNAFGSQNAGRVDVNQAVFGSSPRIPDIVLKRSFQVSGDIIRALKAQFEKQGIKFDIDFGGVKMQSTLP